MSLDAAIKVLEAEVSAFQQGTKHQPKEGSADWYLLRARALSLSHLKRMQQLNLQGDIAAAERHYRKCSNLVKGADVPEPVEVVREIET